MTKYSDLEIELKQPAADGDYLVAIRITPPGSDENQTLMTVEWTASNAGFESLRGLPQDSAEYGVILSATLFKATRSEDAQKPARFFEARAAALQKGQGLRVRLLLAAAPELNGIRW